MSNINVVFQNLNPDITRFTLQYHRHHSVCYLFKVLCAPLKQVWVLSHRYIRVLYLHFYRLTEVWITRDLFTSSEEKN